MTDNLRIWNAVSKTDPSHTKPVEFGRKFTSIDAHWQIMQATKQFGPVGEGWGYTVEHSTATLSPSMVLAVADVTLWWRQNEKVAQFGPVRGTCEMWSQARSKGRRLFEEDCTTPKMQADEDAPKKAMTDALTKGLSHLGFSADVFLGLFDDNRYVQRMKKEFAAAPDAVQAQAQSLQVDPADQAMVNGDGRSQYQTDKEKRAESFVTTLCGTFALSGQTKDNLNQLWKANAKAIDRLEGEYPALHEKLVVAFDKAMDDAAMRAAA